ncbi:MAG: glutaredoxin domain-containing protein [Anaerolineales bacterium]|nr:glutaredoxin domain-containing protein [Anaerolineales bacterium]
MQLLPDMESAMDVVKVYGTTWCGDCNRAKAFMDEHNVDYEWTNVDEETEFVELVLQINNGQRRVPTIVFPDGSVLVEPSNADLAEKLTLEL